MASTPIEILIQFSFMYIYYVRICQCPKEPHHLSEASILKSEVTDVIQKQILSNQSNKLNGPRIEVLQIKDASP